jgi:glycosyltransferase involved in cell wall biosynthesis
MKKRVLHLSKFYLPRLGGIETAVRNIVEEESDEYEHVVLTNSNKSFHRFINKVSVIEKKSLTIFSQPLSLTYIIWYLKNYRNFDIIHLHLPNYLSCLVVYLFPPQKLIVHWHATIEAVPTKKALFPLNLLELKIINRANKIIVGTEKYASSSVNLSKYKNKLVYIYYGCDSQLLPNIEKQNIFVSVGRLVPYKGLVELVTNIIIPDGWIWYIIGDGPLYLTLKGVIESRKLSNQIIVKNKVDNEELKSIYSQSRIFLFPSLTSQESFGISQIEAMSAGNIVFNFNIPNSGVSQIIENEYDGINFELQDYNGLNTSLNELCADLTKLSIMSKNAIQSYHSKFTKSVFANSVLETYSSIFLEQ